MPRGHNKAPNMSAAKWASRKKAPGVIKANSNTKPIAKPSFIVDERASQRKRLRRVEVAPEWAKASKGDHEKIPGTRLQSLPGGIAVRVILEDGTKFPPHKVLAAKRHLAKLAEASLEKERVKKMVEAAREGGVAPAAVDEPVAQNVAPSSNKRAANAPQEPLSKKARKEAAWRDRQQKIAADHAARVAEEGRELVSEQLHEGRVLQRAQGHAWVKLSKPAEIPERVLQRLREATAAIRQELAFGEGDILPIRYADVSDTSLDLRPGVALQFKVFTDKKGVGGCEAKAAAVPSSPESKQAPQEPQALPSAKVQSAETPAVQPAVEAVAKESAAAAEAVPEPTAAAAKSVAEDTAEVASKSVPETKAEAAAPSVAQPAPEEAAESCAPDAAASA